MGEAMADGQSFSYWQIVIATSYEEDDLLPKEEPVEVDELYAELEKAIQESLKEQTPSRKRAGPAGADKDGTSAKRSGSSKRQKTTPARKSKPLPTPSPSEINKSQGPDLKTQEQGAQSAAHVKSEPNAFSTPPEQLSFVIGRAKDEDDDLTYVSSYL